MTYLTLQSIDWRGARPDDPRHPEQTRSALAPAGVHRRGSFSVPAAGTGADHEPDAVGPTPGTIWQTAGRSGHPQFDEARLCSLRMARSVLTPADHGDPVAALGGFQSKRSPTSCATHVSTPRAPTHALIWNAYAASRCRAPGARHERRQCMELAGRNRARVSPSPCIQAHDRGNAAPIVCPFR